MPEQANHGLVTMGYVAKAHGIRGVIVVRDVPVMGVVFTDDSFAVRHFGWENALSKLTNRAVDNDVNGQVAIGDAWYEIAKASWSNKGLLVTLVDVSRREQAERMIGESVAIPRPAVVAAHENVVLFEELVGWTVSDLGRVVMIEPGPQARLLVRGNSAETLVPMVPELVTLDSSSRTIHCDLPEDWPMEPLS